MIRRVLVAGSVAILLGAPSVPIARGGPSALSDADRKVFAWFDGIGLPSCAGKPYVRVRWVADGASRESPRAADVWQVDGFVVAEREGTMTLLDGDLWPRKVSRAPASGWTGGVSDLDLRKRAAAALARLRAMTVDPGAVEAMDQIYPGIRLRFGDEAQSLAFARHCAENGLEREAHALLEAARALPPAPGGATGATFDEVVAAQMAEGVIWRILFDFSDRDIPRASLLARLRGWKTSFPKSPHATRADDALRILPGMVEEEASHSALPDAKVQSLPEGERVRELIWRLRDQGGDVFKGRDGRVSIQMGEGTPAQALVALGNAAAPALVEAVTDEQYTRAVLFIRDSAFRRIVVARVGDVARVALETIAGESFWEVPEDEPSMFQHQAAAEVQKRCREWLRSAVPGAAPEDGGPR